MALEHRNYRSLTTLIHFMINAKVRRQVTTLCASITFLIPMVLTSVSQAQSAYPSKPIRMIVPFSAGGITDVGARIVADFLSRRLGQAVVVDNRAGAGGTIGQQAAAAAPADGYTLLVAADGNMLINPYIYPNQSTDPLKDFVPIGKIGDTALVLLASASGSIKTLADVVSLAKKQPTGLSYGTAGVGSNSHVVGELLKQKSGASLTHIPYKGGAPAMTDLIGNQIPLVVTAVASATSYIKSGKVVPIAVATAQRSGSLPNVPTFMEGELAKFSYSSWLGVFAPASTPKPIVERLNAELNAVLAIPEVRDRFADMGIVSSATSVEGFTEEIRKGISLAGPVVKNAGIRVE